MKSLHWPFPRIDKLLASAVVVLGVCLLSGCGAEEISRPDLPEGKIVQTMVMEEPESSTLRQFPGRVEAYQQAELAFQVAGVLTELPIRRGVQVAKDAVLARLDPRDAVVSARR